MCHILINGTADRSTPASAAKRLDQAILDIIDRPEKTQQTTAIGTIF